jgi:Protein of unknown function (DUF1553)/Protein of unknown function (DUF1549)
LTEEENMTLLRVWLAGVVMATAGTSLPAASPEPASTQDVKAVAAKIDEMLANSWRQHAVRPAPAADDAEFLRRVSLDIAGRIPSVSRLRAFLRDKRSDKRRRLVDELLETPHYVNHFTTVWRGLFIPEANSNIQFRYLAPPMEDWLRKQVRENVPYDAMVREILTVPYGDGEAINGKAGKPTPLAFYYAKELKPENLAASSARLFLGIKLECAQCHNHPFASWTREQFWSYAAFFSGLEQKKQGNFVRAIREVPDRRELTIPGTERVVHAAFPDGHQPGWQATESTRSVLATWVTRPENPYFARAAANRLWAQFFGSGLTDPVDEIVGGQNKPDHPELLDELARQLVMHRFDIQFLIRAITASAAYQATSSASDEGHDDPRLFARMAVRGLSAEQLFDSLVEATGYREPPRDPLALRYEIAPVRASFLNRFGSQAGKPTDVQTSILQALMLMNGKLIADATDLERSETLAAVLDAPFLDTEGRIETLYLATLSRPPRPREASRAQQFIDAALEPDEEGAAPGSAERERRYRHALADVFWALLNSGEFFLNH